MCDVLCLLFVCCVCVVHVVLAVCYFCVVLCSHGRVAFRLCLFLCFHFLSPVAAQRSNKGARVVVDDSSPAGKKTAGHGRGPSVFDDEGATNFSNKM